MTLFEIFQIGQLRIRDGIKKALLENRKNKRSGMERYEKQKQYGERGGNWFLLLHLFRHQVPSILCLSIYSPEPKLKGEVGSQLEAVLIYAST